MSTRPLRVLLHVAHLGFLRNFESTVRELASCGLEIRIAAERLHKRTGKEVDVEALTAELEGVSVCPGAQPTAGIWNDVSPCARQLLDYLAYQDPPLGRAPRLKDRAANLLDPEYRHLAGHALFRSRPGRTVARRVLKRVARISPVDPSWVSFVASHEPDVVAITPVIYSHARQFEYVRAARALGVPSLLLVHSWDNLTTKGFIHDAPDLVAVWNEAQRTEAIKLHGVPPDRIAVTGAPTFDRWFGRGPSRTREELCAQLGLTVDCPFVLWLGSSRFLAPDEPRFVLEWARRLRTSQSRARNAGVLVRPHPLNPFNEDPATVEELQGLGNVVVWPAEGAVPLQRESQDDFFDSVYHCGAVGGVNTSALIEAAILGKRVHSILAPEYDGSQLGMPHFHHLLNDRGGVLHVARDFPRHFQALSKALERTTPDPEAEAFVKRFVRPCGLDRPATEVLADVFVQVAQRRAAPPQSSPLDRPLRRLVSRGAPAVLAR